MSDNNRNNNNNNPFDSETFFKRLTRLFRSGPAIQRKVKGYDGKNNFSNSLIQGNYGYKAAAPFGFGRENSPFSVMGSYGLLDRLSRYSEFCFAPDTLVYTVQGIYTIKELAEKYPNGEIFHVYSYDHKDKQIKICSAHHPRITKEGKPQKLIQIELDDGGIVKTTLDHKFILRDGTHIKANELYVGASLMPFKVMKYTGGYKQIYDLSDRVENRFGWKKEHVMVAEYFAGRKIKDDEEVHHIDHDVTNNIPSNLEIMDASEHKKYHGLLDRGKKQYDKSNEEHSKWMKDNNPVKRTDITFARIFDTAVAVDFSFEKTKQLLKADGNVLKRRLREVGFKHWLDFKENKGILQQIRTSSIVLEEMAKERTLTKEDFFEIVDKCNTIYEVANIFRTSQNVIRRFLQRNNLGTWSSIKKHVNIPSRVGANWSTYDNSLTYQNICEAFNKEMSQEELCTKLNITINKLITRINNEGYNSWHEWVDAFQNHKIKNITLLDEESVVYNVTVDGLHNLAVGSYINADNSKLAQPSMIMLTQSSMEYRGEISTALDILSEETVGGDDRGKCFHIYSSNPEIKTTLDELFYDVLNVEFNLKPWTRNMIKYGDMFLYHEILPDLGIISVYPIRVSEIEREEGFDIDDPYAVRYKWLTRGNKYLENWQVSHFRIQSNDLFAPYGTSMLESSRRIWRTLTMLEDAMLTYRIVRSPERRVFYIDVANVPPNDVESYMEAVKSTMKSNVNMDRSTGREDNRYNALPIAHDSIIPLLDGRNITIKQLAEEYDTGKTNWVHSIDDNTHELLPGKVIWCGKNYTAASIIKVTLDDGSVVKTAPEHPFILRDGSSVRADQLKTDDSLMPFYRKYENLSDRNKKYAQVYNPQTKKYVWTHKFIADSTLTEQKQLMTEQTDWKENKYAIVHHIDCNRFNNNPDNLKWMGNKDHTNLHVQIGTIKADNLIAYSRSPEGRQKTIRNNIRLGLGKKLADCYNGTALHKSHNAIRSSALKKYWADNKGQRSKNITWVMPESAFDILKQIITDNPKIGRRGINKSLLSDANFINIMSEANSHLDKRRKIEKFSTAALKNILKRMGYIDGLDGLRKEILGEDYLKHNAKFVTQQACKKIKRLKNNNVENQVDIFLKCQFDLSEILRNNHKVVSIETIQEECDVYCMTVVGPNNEENRHNFAIMTNNRLENNEFYNGGIFVNNSILDDFYIPIRGTQQGTRIETLAAGQHVTATDDVEFIQKQLFSALKIPRPYLNFTENMSAKASLSQLDIRLSRTIQSLQKIMISELNKLAMIHLYTKGFDGPDLINFELKLSNPSSVALQQKLELWSIKFDTAGTAKETRLVDESWIQKNILELSPTEMAEVEQGLRKDRIREKQLDDLQLRVEDPYTKDFKTVDIFDPSQYEVGLNKKIDNNEGPGNNFDNSAPNVDMQNTDNISGVGSIEQDNSVGNNARTQLSYVDSDDNANPYVTDLPAGKTPIKATPFLSRHRHNRIRRVGTGGQSNLAMPKFNDMLSVNNKYNKDVYGKLQETGDSINSNIGAGKYSLKNMLNEDNKKKDVFSDIRPTLMVTSEMRSIFKTLDKHLLNSKTEKQMKQMLTEQKLNALNSDNDDLDIEIVDEDDNDVIDKLLNEGVGELKVPASNNITDEDDIISKRTLTDLYVNDDEE